jgi:DNA mismatch repair protein MutL
VESKLTSGANTEPPRGNPIRLLPDDLVDQIAAGEVVERPASVVKELVENALDAGAGRLRVECREGGISLIAVTDDGTGMSPGDAALALQRHATSKLRSAQGLREIASFGFRGEALPAIASVSRLRLRTRERGAREGFEIRVEGGRVLEQRAAGGPEGTRVEVADLFASVPARRKYLKKPSTEWGHVSDWLGRLALALPGVHFEVTRDDRASQVWPATADSVDRIAAVLGEQTASTLIPMECEEGVGHLQAFVSAPDRTRGNAAGLYLFVNGRPVRDRVLRHALLDAYRDVLPRGRYPTAVVFLTVSPSAVDVNVHPAKWEVRFADARPIHQLIRRAVREAMSSRSWLGSSGATSIPSASRSSAFGGLASGSTGAGSRELASGAGRVAEGQGGDWILARQRELSELEHANGAAGSASAPGLTPDSGGEALASPRFGSQRLIGQLHASYLLLEGKESLLLVDQHAAHERVLYEGLRSQWLERGVDGQGLLAPESVELEPLAVAALTEAGESVSRLGFALEAFGEAAVVVRSVPALLSGQNPAALVRSLAHELRLPEVRGELGPEDTRLLRAADLILASLACHSARRFGDHLDHREQRALVDALDGIPWAPTCPHGRPVVVSIPLGDIERRFRRR